MAGGKIISGNANSINGNGDSANGNGNCAMGNGTCGIGANGEKTVFEWLEAGAGYLASGQIVGACGGK